MTPETPVRWGVIGTGNIARNFSRGLAVLDDTVLAGVGSRSLEKAQQFADTHGFESAYGSYEELVACPDIEVIYVSTPHSYHKKHSILAMEAGKAVLCEKPFAINAAETKEMIDCAKRNNVFLMEAMWTWFFPAMAKVRELIAEGTIGDVKETISSFSFRADLNPAGRLFNPDLGGGALLDVGIYNAAFARFVHGEAPVSVSALADLGSTGVDEQTTVIQKYANGALASHTCAVRTRTENGAKVYGTDGWMELPGTFWQPKKLILHQGNVSRTFNFNLLGNGMTYEAMEVMNCLRTGQKESSLLPLQTTLEMMQTLDRVRECIDLRYPNE